MKHNLPLFLDSFVIPGFQRGSRLLGVPTANLYVDPKIQQKIMDWNGVYVGWAVLYPPTKSLTTTTSNELPKGQIDASTGNVSLQTTDTVLNDPFEEYYYKPYKAVLSIGNNPHFNGVEKTVEPHLLQKFPLDFYGKDIKLIVCGFIRLQEKFNSMDELIEAINSDIRIGSKMLDQEEMQKFKNDSFFEIGS